MKTLENIIRLYHSRYCTLYALMILKFNNDGPFDIGDATNFFTIGGAWHIIATTMKLGKLACL